MKITGRPRINPQANDVLVYLITNRLGFHESGRLSPISRELQLAAIEIASRSGCQLIQIREKDLEAGELIRFTREAIGLARPHGAQVLVNDRLDVALASGADGVHLRQTSLSPSATRRGAIRAGRAGLLIGVSTHTLMEAQVAESEGADFIVCGPVEATRSGRSDGPLKQPLELTELAAICERIKIPVIALGGLNPANFQNALGAGAAGIAGISIFQQMMTLEKTVARLQAGRRLR